MLKKKITEIESKSFFFYFLLNLFEEVFCLIEKKRFPENSSTQFKTNKQF